MAICMSACGAMKLLRMGFVRCLSCRQGTANAGQVHLDDKLSYQEDLLEVYKKVIFSSAIRILFTSL
jgi:hypothetical protein